MNEPQTREVELSTTIIVQERSCIGPGCDRWFRPHRRGHVFCSNACRQAAYRQRHPRPRKYRRGNARTYLPRET